MFRLKKRRERPQTSFDLSSPTLDEEEQELREVPAKRSRLNNKGGLATSPVADHSVVDLVGSPLSAAEAAEQRSRESSLSQASKPKTNESDVLSDDAASAAAVPSPIVVVNSVAVCRPLFLTVCMSMYVLFHSIVCAWCGRYQL